MERQVQRRVIARFDDAEQPAVIDPQERGCERGEQSPGEEREQPGPQLSPGQGQPRHRPHAHQQCAAGEEEERPDGAPAAPEAEGRGDRGLE